MITKSKRYKRIYIATILILLLVSVISGIYIYKNQKRAETLEKVIEIESVSRLKIKQITLWYNDEINDAVVISKNESLLQVARQAVNDPTKENIRSVTSQLSELITEHGYLDVFLSTDNKERLFTNSSLNGRLLDPINVDYLPNSGMYLTDSNRVYIDLVSPFFKDNSGRQIFIIFRIDPSLNLFNILSFLPIYENSYETMLFSVRNDSLTLLNNTTSDIQTEPILRRYTIHDLIKSRGEINEGVFEGVSHDGKKVVALLEPIPGTTWLLFSKISKSELFTNFRKQIFLSFLLIGLTVLSVSAMISFLYSSKQRNIYKSLWKSQQEFKTTLYSIGDAVIISDYDGYITLMNLEAERLTGWTEIETIGKKLEDVFIIINEYSGEPQENPFSKVIKEGTVVGLANHTLLISRDKNAIPISDSAAPIRDESGNISGVVLIFRDQTEDRKREKALIESEEKYYRMFADSPQPMWIYDLETLEFLEVNEAAVLHYGYSRKEFLSMTIKDIRPKEDIDKLLLDVSTTFIPYNDAGIWRHVKKNGEIIYVNIKSHEVTYNQRIARHVLANDITAIKLAQDALMESEQKFRNLFENHSAVKIILDPETGNIEDANEAAARFYGYDREQLVGMNIRQINTLNDNQIKEEIQNAVDRSRIHFEFTHRISNGTFKDVEVFSSSIFINGKKYLHSIVHDVTEQKKAKHQNRLLIESIEQSPVGILITNPEGFAEFANSRMTDITGYEKEEIVGSLSRILLSTKDNQSQQKRIWSIIRSGDIWKGEFEDQKKNGTKYWAKIAISPIFDSNDSIKHYIMVFEDISEQKKILSELITAKIKAEESDHLKSAFLANMSHEIRTPMNGILGFMDLLQQPGISEDQADEYIKIVKASGERLLSTINDIIDISKIESGQSDLVESTVDVNLLLLEHYNFFKREADQKNIELEIVSLLPENNHNIITDYKKLSSILTNLIKNALKFTKKGSIHIGAAIKDKVVEFTVVDTGKGIPEEKIGSIFDRFVQVDNSIARDHEGSGLGLSISKAYAEMMGGRISVASVPDVGSTFVFTICYKEVTDKLPVKLIEKNEDDEPLENKTILIAEDDEISFIYLNRMLASFKLKLIRAYNGEEAIELMEDNPEVSLILMDIKMPIMDGYQATRILREKNCKVPILALTAFAFSDDKEKAIAAGCNDYLSKPVKKEKLIEMIRRYIKVNATV